MSTSDVKQRMAAGAGWMIALRLSVNFLGFLSTLVLARLLVPGDFGLVALGTSVMAAVELLTSFRFDVSLIQNQSATRAEYDSAWTLNLLMGAALALFLCAAAYPAARFFSEPRLTGVIFVLAACALFDGAQNIGIVNFRKDLEFHREFAFTLSRKLASVVVGVCGAWLFRSYWALATAIATSSLVGLLASYAMHPYRPRWSVAAARSLVKFSKWLVLDNVIQFLRQRSSDVLIGKLAGTVPLGLFNIANEMASLAQATVVAPTNRALLPGYARLAGDLEALRNAYVSVLGMTTLVALPMALGIAVVAPLMVPLVLGNQWLTSTPLIDVLGIAAGISFLGAGGVMVYLALGRPQLLVWLGGWQVLWLLASMLWLLPRFGLSGAAWAVFITTVATLPMQLVLLRHVLGHVLHRWLAAVWRPAVSGAVMYVLVKEIVARASALSVEMRIIDLFESVGAGIVCYVGLVLLLWRLAQCPPGAERAALEQIRIFRERIQRR